MRLLIAIIALLTMAMWAPAQVCIRVIDGDTIVLDDLTRVRLAGIDAPELDQPGGKEAADFLRLYVLERRVTLVGRKRGAWDRDVARIRWHGWDVNGSLVRAGHAWVDVRYDHDIRWVGFEQRARQERQGLWAKGQPVAPWEWRERGQSMDAADEQKTKLRAVLYSMTGCEPCRTMLAWWPSLAHDATLGQIEVAYSLRHQAAADHWHRRITAYPTIVVFRDGTEVGRVVGERSRAQLAEWIRSL